MNRVPTSRFEKTILLRTHPGSLAVKPGTLLVALVDIRQARRHACARLRNFASAFRPNVFPLHDVRYRRLRTDDRGQKSSASGSSRRHEACKSRRRAQRASRQPRGFELIFASDLRGPRREPFCPPSSVVRHLNLVEPDGIEPTTSCLQSTRSPN